MRRSRVWATCAHLCQVHQRVNAACRVEGSKRLADLQEGQQNSCRKLQACFSHFNPLQDHRVPHQGLHRQAPRPEPSSQRQAARIRRSTRPCVTNLLETADFLTDSMSRRQPADVIYLDFAKAFDKVSHELLLVKLSAYGIPGLLTSWIRAFLRDRKQRVVIGDSRSEWIPVTSGVPQGSVLGPLLFVIFITDLPEACSSICKLYADDTKLMSSVHRPGLMDILQKDLDSLVEWSSKWLMNFNLEKCVVMHLGADNERHEYNMGGHVLATTTKERDLGIIMTNDLKSTEQAKRASSRATMVACRVKKHVHLLLSRARQHAVQVVRSSASRVCGGCLESLSSRLTSTSLNAFKDVSRSWFRRSSPDLTSNEEKLSDGQRSKRDDNAATSSSSTRSSTDTDRVNLIHGNQVLASNSQDSPAGRTRHGQLAIERQLVRNCGVRHNFFTNRTVGNWNALDSATRNTIKTNTFKNRIDRALGF